MTVPLQSSRVPWACLAAWSAEVLGRLRAGFGPPQIAAATDPFAAVRAEMSAMFAGFTPEYADDSHGWDMEATRSDIADFPVPKLVLIALRMTFARRL